MTDDWRIVEDALKNARSHFRGFRYGGLMKLYQETGEALEALSRLKQPSFWSDYPRGEDETSGQNRQESDTTG